jgi:hypothetical protein
VLDIFLTNMRIVDTAPRVRARHSTPYTTFFILEVSLLSFRSLAHANCTQLCEGKIILYADNICSRIDFTVIWNSRLSSMVAWLYWVEVYYR